MLGVEAWQAILNGLGAVLAFLYDLIPNYGVAVIVFTLAIRLVLLPLGIKQVRSMQRMQAIQPKVKQIQQKYKGNRQKLNEEVMALYKEQGVNPVSGCLPMVAQIPILISLFAVLQVPKGLTHIPDASQLHTAIVEQDTNFVGANLLCNAGQAGRQVTIPEPRYGLKAELDCGSGFPVRIPYYILAVAMIGTTFYQQRQMQRASPTTNPQQQMLTRVMPLLFGIWGFLFPAALVLYWTTTNVVQIGQQHFLLRQQRLAAAAASDGKPAASEQRKSSERPGKALPAKGQVSKKPGSGTGGSPRGSGSGSGSGRGRSTGAGKRSSADGKRRSAGTGGSQAGGGPVQGGGTGSAGGRDGGDRKKRRKR